MATRKSLSSVVAEPEPDIIIPDYRNVEVSGEKVTEYQVTYHHESGDQTTWHRYSSFCELRDAIISALKGSQFQSSIPPLPPKYWKKTTNHMDKWFIVERRSTLEQWLLKLLLVPRVGDLTSLKNWLKHGSVKARISSSRVSAVAAPSGRGKDDVFDAHGDGSDL